MLLSSLEISSSVIRRFYTNTMWHRCVLCLYLLAWFTFKQNQSKQHFLIEQPLWVHVNIIYILRSEVYHISYLVSNIWNKFISPDYPCSIEPKYYILHIIPFSLLKYQATFFFSLAYMGPLKSSQINSCEYFLPFQSGETKQQVILII